MPKTPMAQPMRTLLGAVNVLSKLNIGPTMKSFLAKSHEERIANKNPGFMTRKVTATIETEDVQVAGRGGPIHVRASTGAPIPPLGRPVTFSFTAAASPSAVSISATTCAVSWPTEVVSWWSACRTDWLLSTRSPPESRTARTS